MNRASAAALLLLPLLLAAPVRAEDEIAPYYEAGRKAEAERDFLSAVADYDLVLDLDEDYEDAFERWDYCQRFLRWQKELCCCGIDAPALVRLGELWLEIGKYDDERKCYEDALELDPDSRDAHGHLALWNYTRGGGFANVYRETLAYLRASPQAEDLAETIADFEIYGAFRNLRALLGDRLEDLRNVTEESRDGVIAMLEETASDEDLPEGARQWCLYQAAVLRTRAGEEETARKAFGAVLARTPSVIALHAHLALAELDSKAGRVRSALAHLEAAVSAGSGACRRIAAGRNSAYEAVFLSDDPAVVELRERLLDPEWADAPIRAAIEAACRRAGDEGKRVLLHWYGPYCPYVMAMQERLSDPRVRRMIDRHYVYVRMDQGSMHRGLSLDEEYGEVMRRDGVPSFFVLDPDGSVVSVTKDIALMGAPQRSYSVEKILEWLERDAPGAETKDSAGGDR